MRTRLLVSIAAMALVAGIGAAPAQTEQRKEQSPAAGMSQGQSGAKRSPSERRGAASEQKSKQTGESRKSETQPTTAREGQRGQTGQAERQKPSGTETRGAQRPDQRNMQGRDQRNVQERRQDQQGSRTGQASPDRQTRISEVLSRQRVEETRNLNVSISVGATLPRSVRARALPREIVQIAPEYRDKRFVVVRDEIIIIEPRTYRIIAVMPRSGGGTAVASRAGSSSFSLTSEQRRIIKEIVITEERVPPAAAEIQLSVGTPVTESIEVRAFPPTVTERVPPVRSYRFFVKGSGVAVVDPREHRIVDVIE